MQSCQELIEALAAASVGLDAGDLPALAALHERCQELKQHVDGLSGPEAALASVVGPQATQARRILEQIILQETSDTAASLALLAETIGSLQSAIAGTAAEGTPETAPQIAPPPAQTTPQPDAPDAHAEQTTEAELSTAPEDLALLAEFVTESREHLDAAEAQLLRLEDTPDDLEAINAVFRSFHTIKGVAGFLNLRQIGALAHASENLLDKARKQELRLGAAEIDIILRALDAMKRLVGDAETASRGGTQLPIRQELPGLIQQIDSVSSGQPIARPAPQASGEALSETDEPNADAPAPGKPPIDKPAIDKPADTPKPQQHVEATVKVATDRLDSLINMVGELVIAQAMVSQDVGAAAHDDPRMARNMSHLGKISRELQEIAMSMRMVPIQGVFQKMTRLARDLGRKFGKEIDFSTVGGETELDRNVVEAIGDPLVHMVRNAIDHGVEPPDVREKNGKPRCGHVQLRAYHQAGSVVIELKDDGKGLSREKILKKALASGIVRENQELADADVYKLIFAAGLSTAEKVTDVSGRGVGMDVVKKNVDSLRGRIDIASEEGKGSTFSIRLPLTLAVIDGLVIRVGSERMIVPINSIEQNLCPRPEQLATVHGRGEVCVVRNEALPLFRLHRLFNIEPKSHDATQCVAVIVHDDMRRCCLLVDELVGQQNVVIKSLGAGVGQVRGVSGGAILGDGTVSLILDVPGLMDLAMQ